MSAGFRAGTSNDAYIQVNGVDRIKIDSSGVMSVDTIQPLTGSSVSLTTTASNAIFAVNKPSGAFTAAILGYRGANARWQIDFGNSTTEAGSNAGSDFAISRYSDAGSFISTALLIARSSGDITSFGNFIPSTTNTVDLGTASLRWRNVYTMDLQLSNGIGDYTVVEGADDLFLYNNKNGKTFKFALIEVDPSVVPPKTSTA